MGAQKRFSPSWSKSERYRNMAEPGASERGLGMNDANSPSAAASCLMTRREDMMLSAQLTASVKRSSMTFCDGPPPWKEYCTGTDIFSSVSVVWRRRSLATSLGVRSK